MSGFELVLFSVDDAVVRHAAAAGIDAVIVDWEHEDKENRQRGADTEINRHTRADLERVRRTTDATVLCRLNRWSRGTRDEVGTAVALGADEVLLPMVRSTGEVEQVLELAGGRCGVGILLETEAGIAAATSLARLPLSRVYVGLNDLAIERRTPSIFTALVDGTVEVVRGLFDVPFGFGGLTLPDRGRPIPCRLLLGELARLGCGFSFLRRSFHRDVAGRDLSGAVARIRAATEVAFGRTQAEVAADRAALVAAIEHLEHGVARAV